MYAIPALIDPRELIEHQRKVAEENDRLDREARAQNNRDAGHPEPKPGTKLFVSTARGIPRRNRGGLRFEQGARRAVEVVDLDDEDVRKRQLGGASIVSVAGAEEILADAHQYGGLAVHTAAASGNEAAALARAAQLETENADLRRQLVDARRDARQGVEYDGSGKPQRLTAAKAASRAATTQPMRPAAGAQGTPPGVPTPDVRQADQAPAAGTNEAGDPGRSDNERDTDRDFGG